jgi:hypothetical protein
MIMISCIYEKYAEANAAVRPEKRGRPVAAHRERRDSTDVRLATGLAQFVSGTRMALSPHLPFDEDETPVSWAVRLAALHTGDAPARFLQDIGVDPRGLMDGNAMAIETLAAAGGADPVAVARNAVERLDDDHVRCRGEVFDRRLWLRQGLRFCMHCLQQDAGWSAKRNAHKLRLRFGWDFSFVERCQVHGVPLLSLPRADVLSKGLPFVADRVQWNTLQRFHAHDDHELPSSLQRYALDRLNRLPGPAWLDGQRLDHAVRACEKLGAAALKGARARPSEFSASERTEAAERGFAIAAEGEPGIRHLLADLQRKCPSDNGHAGPQAMFGDLHDWAARTDLERGPLVDILHRHILETVPVGPGDIVLGQPVAERQVHSVRTLSLAAGVHPKRLRKLLEARGLIRPEDRDRHDNRVVFGAAAGEAAAREITDSIPRIDLPGRLGLGRGVTATLIAEELLTPVLVPDAEHELKERRFLREDVDDLIDRCVGGAEMVDVAPPGFANLRRAASAGGTTVSGLLRAILDGRVSDRRRLTSGHALGALLVNVEAVRTTFSANPTGEALARYRAARRLGTTDRVIAALIADRPGGPILESHPKTGIRRGRARVIPAAALDDFERTYVGLIVLARERSLHHLALAAALAEHGVTPAFDPAAIQATFYRRAEIPSEI